MLWRFLKCLLSLFTWKRKKPAGACNTPTGDNFAKYRARLITRMEEEHRERRLHLRKSTSHDRIVMEVDDFIEAFLFFVHFAGIENVKGHSATGIIRYTSEQPGNLTLQLTDKSVHPRELGCLQLDEAKETGRHLRISIVKSNAKTNKI